MVEDAQGQSKRVEPGFGRIGARHEDDGCGRTAENAPESAVGRVNDRLDGEVGREQAREEHDIDRTHNRAWFGLRLSRVRWAEVRVISPFAPRKGLLSR